MNQISDNIHIGETVLSGKVALAPLAGTSDVVFRTICHEQGAAYGCTELVSARGIRYDPSLTRSFRYLEIQPKREGPVAIQLFGYEPGDFSEAIKRILCHEKLARATCIDINMGCPVPKVVKTGAGAALMKNRALAAQILQASVTAAEPYGVPISVKFRKGWDDGSDNAVEFALMCRDFGAKAIAIHGRTRAQMYHGQSDWKCIAAVADALRGSHIPVFGNGDVRNGGDALRMLQETNVDGVMVGRAAQGNPWLFREISTALETGEIIPYAPTPQERADMIRRHLHELCEKEGESMAILEMRTQIAFYLRGLKNIGEYKAFAMQASTYEQIDALLTHWVEEQALPLIL